MPSPFFIWLDPARYPSHQHCPNACDGNGTGYTVAEFTREYTFSENIVNLTLHVGGDTAFSLFLNGKRIGNGPASAGGDYNGVLHRPAGFPAKEEGAPYGDTLPVSYLSVFRPAFSGKKLSFTAYVRLSPLYYYETSAGQGGFFLSGRGVTESGREIAFGTDESWLCRRVTACPAPTRRDFLQRPDDFSAAREVRGVFRPRLSPLLPLAEEEIQPAGFSPVSVLPGEEKTFCFSFDKIYAAAVLLSVRAEGPGELTLTAEETPGKVCFTENFRFAGSFRTLSQKKSAVGLVTLCIRNLSATPLLLQAVGLLATHYPMGEMGEGHFSCSDPVWNRIYEIGRHTTNICRQLLELDSPLHSEGLGCTGDYLIKSLIAYHAFGDTTLSRFDILRTADLLRHNDGFMFHTGYSLLWVEWLYTCGFYRDDPALYAETEDALSLLFNRFATYADPATGLIESPPNYMFVDWIAVDGYSLHHPPKALGQTVLNALYYHALTLGAAIEERLENNKKADLYRSRAAKVAAAFCPAFYDSASGLFFAGKATPEKNVNCWLPENTEKRYFTVQANVLAVLYGLCPQPSGQARNRTDSGEEGRRILQSILHGGTEIPFQPYFAHFIFEALDRTGLFEEEAPALLARFGEMVKQSDKGMKEGWLDMPGYAYDFSHAWGASPTYHLPVRLSGFRMTEPGYRAVSLAPRLCGLDFAEISLPTPFGPLECRMEKGKPPVVRCPAQIRLSLR